MPNTKVHFIALIFYVLSSTITYSQEAFIPYNPGSCSSCRTTTGSEEGPFPSTSEYAGFNLPTAMGSYGNTPVDLYTGVPSISIPLYTVQCRDYSLPISLNYDASGIKTKQEASWVGLGWNISGVSPVSRIIRGGDDFVSSPGGTDNAANYASMTPISNAFRTSDPSNACVSGYMGGGGDIITDQVDAEKNLQSDIFVVNVAGRTIKFILDAHTLSHTTPYRHRTREVHLLAKEKVRIELLYTMDHDVPAFEITTEDGTKYYYGEVPVLTVAATGRQLYTDDYSEVSKVTYQKVIPGYYQETGLSYCNLDRPVSYDVPPPDCGTWVPEYTITESTESVNSWLLRKIITPLGDEINFVYDKHFNYRNFSHSVTDIYYNLSSLQLHTPNRTAKFEKNSTAPVYRLKEIIFPIGKVNFVKSNNRVDVSGSAKEPSLTALEIYSSHIENKLVKKYQFDYSYFNPSWSSTPNKYSRLKLVGVKEVDVYTGDYLPPHSFVYNENTISSKSSTGDHWGYQNAGGIWGPTQEKVIINGITVDFKGAIRDVGVAYLQAGILTKMTYPTGGFSEFTYEANDYYSPSLNKKEVGGLRIKQIRVSDGVNTAKDMYTSYKYLLNDGSNNFTSNSSGVLMEDVLYTWIPPTSDGYPVYRSEYNILPVGTHYNGNVVGYSEVTVLSGLNGELGKTIYKYHAYPNYYYDNLTPSEFMPAAYYEFVYNTIHGNSPVFSSQTNANKKYLNVFNGLMKSSKTLRIIGGGYKLLSEVESFYNEFDNTLLSNATFFPNVLLYGNITHDVVECCPNNTTLTPISECPLYATQENDYTNSTLIVYKYLTPSIKIRQTSLKEYIYDQIIQTRKMVKETTFEYANDVHYQLTKTCVNDIYNPEATTCTEYYYAADYNMEPYHPLTYMGKELREFNMHIHNAPIETIVKRKVAGVFKVIGGTLNKYKRLGPYSSPSPIVLDETYKLETDVPLTEGAGYYKSSLTSQSSSFTFDSHYQSKVKINQYDAKSNVVETLNEVGFPSAIIYGYSQNLPIGKVSNAYRSQVSYAGFESGTVTDDDGWVLSQGVLMDANVAAHKPYVYSGRYSVKIPQGTGPIFGPTKDVTPSPQTGKYKVSCYIKTDALSGNAASLTVYTKQAGDNTHAVYPTIPQANISVPLTNTNGQWQYFEAIIDLDYIRQSQSIPASVNLSLRSYVVNNDINNPVYMDEIRVHPVDGEMTTYTYQPLIGKTSESDINHRTSFIEYDGFNRVRLIRDHENNILKKYKYFYKQ